MDTIILHIETSTKACSVAISKEMKLLALVESNEAEYSHAEKLNLFIEEALKVADLTMKDLSAVAVSEGPGSFTGLRIGVSTAKGIAYALDLPLIAVSTLRSIAQGFIDSNDLSKKDIIVSTLDARRREVYMQLFDPSLNAQSEIEAKVLDQSSFEELKNKNAHIHLVGDGASKFADEFKDDDQVIVHSNTLPSSAFMIAEAWDAYQKKKFVDSAYFEPHYLKDFIAIKPRKIF
jgi:tRNA threonylcarbamoyladenosine biosynthesis protein TsaB